MSKRKELFESSNFVEKNICDDFACLYQHEQEQKQISSFTTFLQSSYSYALRESRYYSYFKNECVKFPELNLVLIMFIFFLDAEIMNALIAAQNFKIVIWGNKPTYTQTDDLFPPLPPLRRTKHIDCSALLDVGESGLFRLVKREKHNTNKEINYFFLERIGVTKNQYWGVIYVLQFNMLTNVYDLCRFDLVRNYNEDDYISYNLNATVEPIKFTP